LHECCAGAIALSSATLALACGSHTGQDSMSGIASRDRVEATCGALKTELPTIARHVAFSATPAQAPAQVRLAARQSAAVLAIAAHRVAQPTVRARLNADRVRFAHLASSSETSLRRSYQMFTAITVDVVKTCQAADGLGKKR
jgi:hypothetical protein